MIESNDHTPTISLHYTLRFADGTVFDGSEEHGPLQCRLGDGTLHPALERCLAGLATGAHETFHITSEQGFGPYDPEMVHALDLSKYDEEAMRSSPER
ncbi:MAG: FKBP-type peptidyl-prolyl cis-trans isomerase [Acidihalobacter sp.]